jgi:hypothetical protein
MARKISALIFAVGLRTAKVQEVPRGTARCESKPQSDSLKRGELSWATWRYSFIE